MNWPYRKKSELRGPALEPAAILEADMPIAVHHHHPARAPVALCSRARNLRQSSFNITLVLHIYIYSLNKIYTRVCFCLFSSLILSPGASKKEGLITIHVV